MNAEPTHSIGTRTARGMLWAFGSYIGGRFLILLATAVLARLLTPADFGLVALALTFIALLEGISNLGLGQALIIQDESELDEHAETAFVWSIAFGFVAAALIAALSPLIASFFDEPELVGIVSVLGGNLFLRSLGITHYSLAQRGLDFRARTIAELTEAIVRGVVGIGLALAGLGVWSLVLGYLVGTVALDIAIWALVPWRPTLRARRRHLPRLLRFGGTLSAVDVTAAVGNNIDYLFVGRALGATQVGLYSIAFAVPRLTVVNISGVAEKVLFPALAIHDREQLGRAYLITIRYLWMLALPVCVLLALLAEPLILAIFGDQWADAAAPMRVLAIYGFAMATGFAAGTVYKATGKIGVVLMLVLVRVVLLVIGLALFVDLGITAVAACQAVAVGSVEAVGLVLASRLLDVRLGALGAELWPTLAAGLAMAGPVVAVEQLVGDPWIAVTAGGLVGVAIYLGTLLLVAPDAVRYLRDKLLPSLPERSTAAGLAGWDPEPIDRER